MINKSVEYGLAPYLVSIVENQEEVQRVCYASSSVMAQKACAEMFTGRVVALVEMEEPLDDGAFEKHTMRDAFDVLQEHSMTLYWAFFPFCDEIVVKNPFGSECKVLEKRDESDIIDKVFHQGSYGKC